MQNNDPKLNYQLEFIAKELDVSPVKALEMAVTLMKYAAVSDRVTFTQDQEEISVIVKKDKDNAI